MSTGGSTRQYFEADVTKAFTGASMKFDKVPVFNHFDILQKYDDNKDFTKMSDYTRYFEDTAHTLVLSRTVRNSHLMLKYNLCYGYFLKKVRYDKTKDTVSQESFT